MKEVVLRILDMVDRNFDKLLVSLLITGFALLFLHSFHIQANETITNGLFHTMDTLVGFLGGLVTGAAIARHVSSTTTASSDPERTTSNTSSMTPLTPVPKVKVDTVIDTKE